MPFTEDGNWYDVILPACGQPALFLDRDGVIIEDCGYIERPDQVELIPGAAEVIREFAERNYSIVVVTNQSGIGRGFSGWDAFHDVQREISTLLSRDGAYFNMVLACPFHSRQAIESYRVDSDWRKPGAGMINFAADKLKCDLSRSKIVGDKLTDLQAGASAGLKDLVHVLTGHGERERGSVIKWSQEVTLVNTISDLLKGPVGLS